MTGKTISHYKIAEKLGGGGMGVVYKAEDLKLNRTVALKFLPPELTRDEEAKKRFIQEARAASSLQHNNICTIHDIEETEDGQIFICMDCYEGETLKEKIERGPLKIKEALDIAVQVSEGLQKAHEKGITHRDIKPANIFITSEGQVKILDFGLAKLSGQTMMTKTGSTVGTAAYMSPEQARGEQVDSRTDVWAFGVVLYEMSTGRFPFKGEYDNAVIYNILNEEPEQPSKLQSNIPEQVERVILKSLRKNPDERFKFMDEMLSELKTCLETRGGVSKRYGKGLRGMIRRGILPFGISVGLLSLALMIYFLIIVEESEAPVLKMIAVLPFQNLGPAEDEYFADGLTDEITSRLSRVGNLGVISSTSSSQYKKTTKALPVIAKELGVDYILEGTIRWVKTGDGARIRITPRLIKISQDMLLWSDNMDRNFIDIFTIQTEIALKVVGSLDIVLNEFEKHGIEKIPTKNTEAYKLYLRGISIGSYERQDLEKKISIFKEVVGMDSTFALAFLRLSNAHMRYHWFGFDHANEHLSLAKKYLDSAFALQPQMPEAYFVLGYYYYFGFRNYDLALKAFSTAEKGLPNNSNIILAKAYILRRQGKFEESLELQKEGLELDPKFPNTIYEMGVSLSWMGRFAEAEEYLERHISIRPNQVWAYIRKADICLLWTGDIKKSRSEIERIVLKDQPWEYLTRLDIYERNYISALNRLSKVTAPLYEDQVTVSPVSMLRGIIYGFTKDTALSKASFDTARAFLESEIKNNSNDERLHSALGIVYAGLGMNEAAVHESEHAIDLLSVSKDPIRGTFALISYVKVLIMTGKYDDALGKLEYLLSPEKPKIITAQILRLDPIYDPLRNSKRFKSLLSK